MDAKVALWREVESGARYTVATAMARYPLLNKDSCKGLPSEIALKPRTSNQGARDTKTYAAAAVDALAARLAEPVDPLWREVESGARYTVATAMARYPQLTKDSVYDLPSKIARKPKIGNISGGDVMTYSAADVEALASQLAAPVDPLWREVESGTRYTATTAMARYPQLHKDLVHSLPFEIARKPTMGTSSACDVKTFSAADVDALVARLAAPVDPLVARLAAPVDPLWREVESGARYTATTAMARYRHLNRDHFADLPFEIARKPKDCIGGARDVKTYSAAAVDALAAARAKRPAAREERLHRAPPPGRARRGAPRERAPRRRPQGRARGGRALPPPLRAAAAVKAA